MNRSLKLEISFETQVSDDLGIELISNYGTTIEDLSFLHGHNSETISQWALDTIMQYGSQHRLYESFLLLYIHRPVSRVSDERIEACYNVEWTGGQMNPEEYYAIILTKTPTVDDEALVASIAKHCFSGFRSASLHALATYYPGSIDTIIDIILDTSMSDITNTGGLIDFSNILRFWQDKKVLTMAGFIDAFVSRGGCKEDERLQIICNLAARHVFDLPFPEFRL